MKHDEVFAAVLVDEQQPLDPDQFAQACGVSRDWISVHVEAGVFATSGDDPASWTFSVTEIRRAHSIYALERDFNALPELAALVLDLQDELARLRALSRRGQ